LKKIKNILIVGGTHGNERTGVFLIEKWLKFPNKIARDNLNIDLLLANPDAIKGNRRYLEKDLNRCFSNRVLRDPSQKAYEVTLARKLEQRLGGKGQCRYDLIIDLHTSTANMGVNLVLTRHDRFHHTMIGYLQQCRNDVVATSEAEMIPDHHFLCALAEHNVIVEVGPVAQGLLHCEAIEKTEQTVMHLLNFVEHWNEQSITGLPETIDIYEYTGKVPLPQDNEGRITGYVHPAIQGKDFQLLTPGTPIFTTMEGHDLLFDESEPCYISFVNEAAYYDQKLAFCTLKRVRWPLADDPQPATEQEH
jgi:aspartoacylase